MPSKLLGTTSCRAHFFRIAYLPLGTVAILIFLQYLKLSKLTASLQPLPLPYIVPVDILPRDEEAVHLPLPSSSSEFIPTSSGGNTLGFLQSLCKHDGYNYPYTSSCFYSPTDLWPDTFEFAPYVIHTPHYLFTFSDFLNDDFNGVSWCPLNHTVAGAPCRWHHHVSLMNFAMSMLNKWNITFFLDTGGLIGSLRNGGFELTDHDLDFAAWIPDDASMDRLKRMIKDASTIIKAKEAANENEGLSQNHVTMKTVINGRLHANFLSYINGTCVGHVDVWRFNVTAGNHSNIRTSVSWFGGSGEAGTDKASLFPLGQCNFMGRIVPCPHHPYTFLKQRRDDLHKSDLFVSPGTNMYTAEISRRSANSSMECLELGGFPTLRSEGTSTRPFFDANDPRGLPPLSG